MATNRWVRIAKDPFGEASDDGTRVARINSGTGSSTNVPDLAVLISVKAVEGEAAELAIAVGPTSEIKDTGMDLSKGVAFHGELALAVAALIGLGAGRFTSVPGSPLGGLGITFLVED